MSTIDDDDLTAALARAFPQGYALLRCEGGTGILRIGAREVLRNPVLAQGTVAPRGLRALARALRAVGQQDIACADRLDELAAEAEAATASAPDTPHSRSYNAEPPNTDWTPSPTRARARAPREADTDADA